MVPQPPARPASPAGLPDPGRCLVMGVVNVTPDSFSDGGDWFGTDAAIQHGLDLAAQGADIIDVGGESTRPGAQRISAEEELRRVGPVIAALVAEGLAVSVDTMRAPIVEHALAAGARLVNDVSGGLADPAMPRLVGKAGVPYVVVHWRGHSHDMYRRAIYQDVVAEVRDELRRRVDTVAAEGVDPSLIIIDPGLGFAKRAEHNWALLTHLGQLGDDRPDPAQLFLGRDALCAGPGRLASDIDDVGALPGQVQAVLDGGVRPEPGTAVGERVRRHVDHAHHQAPPWIRETGR